MKALRYIDNTGVMRVQVVPDDYELTRDEQRRLGKDFWFEGLYEALGAKDDHDKKRKGQPAEPWLKEFVTPGDRQVATNMLFYGAKDPEDYGLSPGVLAITFDGFGLASRYPEAVGGPGAPDDREEDRVFRYDTGGGFIRSMGADHVEAEFALLLARAEKAEAEVARLREAAINLRNAQRAYMADRGNNEKGRVVARMAEALDAALDAAAKRASK